MAAIDQGALVAANAGFSPVFSNRSYFCANRSLGLIQLPAFGKLDGYFIVFRPAVVEVKIPLSCVFGEARALPSGPASRYGDETGVRVCTRPVGY